MIVRFLIPVVLLATVASAQDLPKPKLIQSAADSPAVTKGDVPAVAKWQEIQADPITTLLQAPGGCRWLLIDTDGAELRPVQDGKQSVFAATKPGRYRIVVAPETGDQIRVAVLVGTQPAPPVPVPPVPVPPVPPTPVPPEPPALPQSDIGKKLQAAFDADPADKASKAKMIALKAELYKQASVVAADPTVTTTGALLGRVKAAATALGVDGLAGVGRVIAAELQPVMPSDVALSPELRLAAAAVFSRVSAALKEVR